MNSRWMVALVLVVSVFATLAFSPVTSAHEAGTGPPPPPGGGWTGPCWEAPLHFTVPAACATGCAFSCADPYVEDILYNQSFCKEQNNTPCSIIQVWVNTWVERECSCNWGSDNLCVDNGLRWATPVKQSRCAAGGGEEGQVGLEVENGPL